MSRIRPELEHLAVPVEQMCVWPGNPRRGDLDDIAAKLDHFGQYQPIVVQKSSGRIVVGNHRYTAATQNLGWKTLAAVFLELDDDTAATMLAADNRASDQGHYDLPELAKLLDGLPDLEPTGWTYDELDHLLGQLSEAGEQAMSTLPPPAATFAPPATPPSPVPAELAAVPDTDARYAETPEQEAARAEKIGTQVPRAATGLTETILVYEQDDRAELQRLVADAREVYGEPSLKAADIVLRAMRVLLVIFDARDDPSPISTQSLCTHAGLDA